MLLQKEVLNATGNSPDNEKKEDIEEGKTVTDNPQPDSPITNAGEQAISTVESTFQAHSSKKRAGTTGGCRTYGDTSASLAGRTRDACVFMRFSIADRAIDKFRTLDPYPYQLSDVLTFLPSLARPK